MRASTQTSPRPTSRPWPRLLCWLLPAACLLLLLAGCGGRGSFVPRPSASPASATTVADGPLPVEELASAPTPRYPARAVWANEIELLGFDTARVGTSRYQVEIYFKCLSQPTDAYALTFHLQPANDAVLTSKVPLAAPKMEALMWDFIPAPATNTWQAGKFYRLVRVGTVPPDGWSWSLAVGFYRAANGQVLELKKRTDGREPDQVVLMTRSDFGFD